ncbi:hypothetical protein GGS26DRAFT_177994 [Hypomontagnella submonticulosa]|nr:hypothetical protein GGS26DRAFT_177994 [Hypomontagnella submonticulosa]
MVSRTTLALLGLASTAAATYSPEGLKKLHGLRQEHVVVEVRQAQSSDFAIPTGTSPIECTTSLLSIITDIPTPPPKVESYLSQFASTADLTDPAVICEVTKVPESVSADYSSYDQAASSWFNKHNSEIDALASKCAGDEYVASIDQAVSALNIYIGNGCSGTLGAPGATTTTGTGSGSTAGASAASTSPSTALAARPTGIVAGAVAAAGVLGAAALL